MVTGSLSKDGKILNLSIPMTEPRDSSSGKSQIVASSQGFQATAAIVDGKPVKVNVTAIVMK